ncbi:unnamed protein product, partial [Scytosiphon promiscuus]
FGAPAPAPAPSAFGSTFGSTAAPAPAPSAFGGAFGAPAPAPAPSVFGGAFGATPAPAPASSGFGFGFGTPAPAPGATSLFGGGAAGAPAAASAGGTLQGITPETRYDQLPEAARKQIDELAKEIKRQRGVADEVSRANPTHGLELQAKIRELRRDLLDLGNEQATQKLAMKDLKADADETCKHAEVHGLFVVQRMRSDSGLNTVEQLPSEYMWDMVESFEKRLHEYAQEINALQLQLSDEPLQGGEMAAPYGQRTRVTPGRLAFVIREQLKAFNQIAGHAAVAHEQVEALRQAYKQQFKDDPFEAAERQERAAERRLHKQMRDQAPQQPVAAPAPPAAAPAAQAPASAWG